MGIAKPPRRTIHRVVIPKSPPAERGTAAWRIIAHYPPRTGIPFDPNTPKKL